MQENFRKFSKFVLLIRAIFYEKIPKFSKIAKFALKPLFFKFSAPSAPKICTFDTQKTRFFVVRAPLRPGSPLIYLWLEYFCLQMVKMHLLQKWCFFRDILIPLHCSVAKNVTKTQGVPMNVSL